MGSLEAEIWQCPECGRSVNGFVNGCRCPFCQLNVADDCGCRDGRDGVSDATAE